MQGLLAAAVVLGCMMLTFIVWTALAGRRRSRSSTQRDAGLNAAFGNQVMLAQREEILKLKAELAALRDAVPDQSAPVANVPSTDKNGQLPQDDAHTFRHAKELEVLRIRHETELATLHQTHAAEREALKAIAQAEISRAQAEWQVKQAKWQSELAAKEQQRQALQAEFAQLYGEIQVLTTQSGDRLQAFYAEQIQAVTVEIHTTEQALTTAENTLRATQQTLQAMNSSGASTASDQAPPVDASRVRLEVEQQVLEAQILALQERKATQLQRLQRLQLQQVAIAPSSSS
jgi:hypothetical protein